MQFESGLPASSAASSPAPSPASSPPNPQSPPQPIPLSPQPSPLSSSQPSPHPFVPTAALITSDNLERILLSLDASISSQPPIHPCSALSSHPCPLSSHACPAPKTKTSTATTTSPSSRQYRRKTDHTKAFVNHFQILLAAHSGATELWRRYVSLSLCTHLPYLSLSPLLPFSPFFISHSPLHTLEEDLLIMNRFRKEFKDNCSIKRCIRLRLAFCESFGREEFVSLCRIKCFRGLGTRSNCHCTLSPPPRLSFLPPSVADHRQRGSPRVPSPHPIVI